MVHKANGLEVKQSQKAQLIDRLSRGIRVGPTLIYMRFGRSRANQFTQLTIVSFLVEFPPVRVHLKIDPIIAGFQLNTFCNEGENVINDFRYST